MLRLSTALRALACGLAALAGPAAAAASSDNYVIELSKRADTLGLADSREWHALLHYRPKILVPGVSSEADAPEFFLSPNGVDQPEAELEATLHVLFAPNASSTDDDADPRCCFLARDRWLREALDVEEARIARPRCPRFEAWREAIAPSSVTLIFPEAYMNNPSSMFGHTLLRFDTHNGGRRRDLLAYASNFAAHTGDDGAITFAWKGIAGYYPGLFTLMPYYEKVREYGDWEQRDLWEYELNFSRSEIDRMLEHLWELRGIRFDYFFFDENCSYRLLRLLEVARPSLQLSDKFHYWAIPADTVRAVARDGGLVRHVRFRPSATTELRQLADRATPEERALALMIASGERKVDAVADRATASQARVLTLAHDILRHSFLARDIDREGSFARAREILLARSRMDADPPAMSDRRPTVRPDEGHETARVSIGGGVQGDRSFAEIAIRPAFHDLLDNEGGYTRGAMIDFLQATARYYGSAGGARLHRLGLVDIVSLSPRDDLFRPISWRASTSVASLLLPDQRKTRVEGLEDRYAWRNQLGAGLAYNAPLQGLAYGLAEGTLDVGRALQDHHAMGLGGELGLIMRPFADRMAVHLSVAGRRFVTGSQRTDVRAAAEHRFTLGPRNAIRVGVAHRHAFGDEWLEAVASWQRYF